MRKSILLFLLFVFLLNTLTIVSFAEEKEVPINDFHTQEMFSYINDNYLNVSEYADGKQELSIPRGIICDFSSDDIGTSDSYIFQKASDETFSDLIIIENITERIYTLHNLKLGEHFYWRAATSYEMLDKSPIHEITVTDIGPRNCYIDGVTNVRDIGGYKSNLIENSKIRQGYYYRGANLNGITDEGKRQMTEELGIKAEIDIRDVYQCLGPYIDGVEYNTFPIPSGTEIYRFSKFNEQYYGIFTVIANADTAPVYLHCTAGADRTGITTFMLLAVCGVEYEDIARDYLFSNFSTNGLRNLDDEFVSWWDGLKEYGCESQAENAKIWMKSKGIEEEKIERIREIFVDGYISNMHNERKYNLLGAENKLIYNVGSEKGLLITTNAPSDSFIGVKIDGKALLDAMFYYDSESGILTIMPEYLDTYPIGKYSFTVVYDKGEVDGTISINKSLASDKE